MPRSSIYFIGIHEDGSRGIWSMPVGGGEPVRMVVFDDPSFRVFRFFTVGPDNFYFSIGEYESDIWVVDLEW